MITLEEFKIICPNNKQPKEMVDTLNKVLPKYNINTKNRVAAWLSQCSHESNQFTVMKENLNYSTKGLCCTWPSRFKSESVAAPYNRNPEMIANKVYCDRLGNGDEDSGDGYTYRGRGFIQTTGKSNYQSLAESIDMTLQEVVNYCETLEGAITSACHFWDINKLNQYADSKDFITLTKKINGGTLGLDERRKYYNLALKTISLK